MAGMQITVEALFSKAGKTVILEDAPSSLRTLNFRERKTMLTV